jgi:serine/threonine-protein kinase HipA
LKRLKVYLSLSEKNEILVGELAEKDKRIFFQYNNDFIKRSLWLSPYKLPLSPSLFRHDDLEFGPIFGLFDDSLPDGWGLMLMDRFLRNKGISIESLSILDRLSFFGSNTMGALTYKPESETLTGQSKNFDLFNLYVQSQEIITGRSQNVLDELMRAGGSPGGARPKVLVGVKGDTLISSEGDLPEGFEHWIIKFSGPYDLHDSGSVEYAYSLMARECGIVMPETRVFKTEKGGCFFGIKRFDREYNQRIHTHTLGNLIHSNFRIPSLDYEDFFKVTKNLTKNYQNVLSGFRQMTFNILSCNRDDHVKNFSYLMNSSGEWALSPAYDITFSKGPGGEHSMTVDGEGRSPSIKNIYSLGEKAGLKKNEVIQIVEEVSQAVNHWNVYAEKAAVSEKSMEIIQQELIEKHIT